MSDQNLDISNVINISILTVQQGLALPNINTAALMSTETPEGWDEGQTFKLYTNASDVLTDFGSDSKAYGIAAAFFAQQPNVLTTNGYLAIILLGTDTVEQSITNHLNSLYFFGVLVDTSLADDAFALLATYIQTLDKILFYASDDPADFAADGLFDDVRAAGETHTRCLYYKTDNANDTFFMAAAYAGRALSTDFSGSNTTETMHLKTLATLTPQDDFDQTALEAAQDAGVDVYIRIAGISSLFTSGANAFFDEVYNELWLKFALQVAGFNYLRQTNTKIPQTEAGMNGLKGQYLKVCAQAVRNGFAGPGAWNSSTVFGDPASLIRNVANLGYYVYSQPIADQSQAERESREAPLVQIAVKTQGAIHKSSVIVNVNL